jgi:hypothetical protein
MIQAIRNSILYITSIFFSKNAGELRFIILRRKKEGKRSLRVQEKTQHIPTHVNTHSLAHTNRPQKVPKR